MQRHWKQSRVTAKPSCGLSLTQLRKIPSRSVKNCAGSRHCNGEIQEAEMDKAEQMALIRVEKLLFADGVLLNGRICGLFVNRDARGYALKLDSEWTRGFNNQQYPVKLPTLHTDMGGHGILAPDLNVK
jgi:hypothetical protein